jgi:malate dehydrogenase
VAASPDAIFIIVSNPLDAMCHVAFEAAGIPRERLIGMAGVLDSARFRSFIAAEADVSVEDVSAMVLGGHGDTMVPISRYSTVAGVPITQIFEPEVVKPGASVVEMVDSILLDKRRVLPCSVHLDGEYGLKNLFVGVPVKLGEGGVRQVIELNLTDDEKAALHKSAAAVQDLVDAMERLKSESAATA